MVNTKTLQTEEARYHIDVFENGEVKEITHFVIDCACKPLNDGHRKGSFVKNIDSDFVDQLKPWQPTFARPNQTHTFYINAPLLEGELDRRYTTQPMEIVCRDCHREFRFNKQEYRDLVQRIERENNSGE